MIKVLAKSILVAGIALGLSACGKSENVTEAENVIAGYDTALSACADKKAMEASNCIQKAMTEFGEKWNKAATKAAQDDPEAIQKLTTKYTELTTKGSTLIQNAFK